MIVAGLPFPNTVLHQTGQARQDRNRRKDTLMVEVAAKGNLALGNIASQVGYRMGDVVIGHGQDRNLGDRAFTRLDASRAFVERGQITIEIAGISFAAGNFTTDIRYLA